MRSRACLAGLALLLVLASCGEQLEEPEPIPPNPQQVYIVTRIIDGDSIEVVRGDAVSTVDLLGIDAPEWETCEGIAADEALGRMLLGKPVELTVSSRPADIDEYGHWLRYVGYGAGARKDAGLEMLKRGFAVARYDSRDGYGVHPREADYIAADEAATDYECTSSEITTSN